jgi:hypothetical protein
MDKMGEFPSPIIFKAHFKINSKKVHNFYSICEKELIDDKLFCYKHENEIKELKELHFSWLDFLPDLPKMKILSYLDKPSLVDFFRAYWIYWDISQQLLLQVDCKISNDIISLEAFNIFIKLFKQNIKLYILKNIATNIMLNNLL